MMLTGLPNLAWVFGYFRASLTLRADIVADFVCRLLKHMDETGAKKVSVALRPHDKDMPLLPWIDPEKLQSRLHQACHARTAQARRQTVMIAQSG
jgi:cation diffusion facilitator CzcD-associated flavoprotein CzcO